VSERKTRGIERLKELKWYIVLVLFGTWLKRMGICTCIHLFIAMEQVENGSVEGMNVFISWCKDDTVLEKLRRRWVIGNGHCAIHRGNESIHVIKKHSVRYHDRAGYIVL